MDNEAQIILDDTISFCERDGIDARLINMLKQSRGLELTDTTLTLEAPSRFAAAALTKQRATIERYLEEIAFAPVSLTVTTALPATENVSRETVQAPQPAPAPAAMGATMETAPAAVPAAPAQAAPAMSTAAAAASHAAVPAPVAAAPTIASAPAPAISIASSEPTDDEGEARVKVVNTISAGDLKRLMSSMSQAPAPAVGATAPAAQTAGTGNAAEIGRAHV